MIPTILHLHNSCPLRRGRERGSLFSFGQPYIKIFSRESQLITLLLLQMLFSSGRDRSHNIFNLGRVILEVSIPSSSFSSISSNCSQSMTKIISRLCSKSRWNLEAQVEVAEVLAVDGVAFRLLEVCLILSHRLNPLVPIYDTSANLKSQNPAPIKGIFSSSLFFSVFFSFFFSMFIFFKL